MARSCFYVFLTAMVVANQLFFSSSLAMHRRCMAREEGVGGLTIHRVYTLCCIMSPLRGFRCAKNVAPAGLSLAMMPYKRVSRITIYGDSPEGAA